MSLEGNDANFFDTVTLTSADGKTIVKFRNGVSIVTTATGSIIEVSAIATGEELPTPCGRKSNGSGPVDPDLVKV